MPLPDQLYDTLRWVSQYVLPGLGTLYFALAQIWGWPYGQQIVGSITALVTFINITLGASSNAYDQIEAFKSEKADLINRLETIDLENRLKGTDET